MKISSESDDQTSISFIHSGIYIENLIPVDSSDCEYATVSAKPQRVLSSLLANQVAHYRDLRYQRYIIRVDNIVIEILVNFLKSLSKL